MLPRDLAFFLKSNNIPFPDPAETGSEDSKRFALKLQDAGVDVLDVSGGLCGSRPERLQGIQGYFVDHAYQIRKVVSVPVVGVGGIKDPEYADRLVQDGRIDLIAVGTELWKDPEWAVKALQVYGGL